jgi:predicted nucleic acid-binding protein
MAVVVDASALGAIMFGEPEGPTLAAHLKGETLLAPSLLDFEIINLAVKKCRRRPDLIEPIAVALAAALAVPIERAAIDGRGVFALAAVTGLTAYDASYLWLARSRDAELVTLDRELMRLSDAALRV